MATTSVNVGRIDEALVSLLTGDAGLMSVVSGVYRGEAPPGAVRPYVIFALQDAPKRPLFNGHGHVELAYLVKVVVDGFDASPAQDAATLVDGILVDGTLAPVDHDVLGVLCEQAIDYAEQVGDELLHHSGGVYKIWVEAAPPN